MWPWAVLAAFPLGPIPPFAEETVHRAEFERFRFDDPVDASIDVALAGELEPKRFESTLPACCAFVLSQLPNSIGPLLSSRWANA